LNEQSSKILNKHVAEWSAEHFLDCWVTQEEDVIEAKAFFNKK